MPALKDIASEGGGIVVCSPLVVGAGVGSVRDPAHFFQLTAVGFVHRVVVAVDIDAVHVIDGELLTGVVEANGATTADVGPSINERRIGTELIVTGQFNEVLCLGEEVILGRNGAAVLYEVPPVPCSVRRLAGQGFHIELHVFGAGTGRVS